MAKSNFHGFCCPSFDPSKWDGKEFTWRNKLFLKETVSNFFKCPPDFSNTITKVKSARALPPEIIMLSSDTALWTSEVYVSVSREVPEAEVVKFSGRFMAKVFEGTCKDTSKLMEKMEEFVRKKGRTVKKAYFFYNLCGECGRAYGSEYTAILAEV